MALDAGFSKAFTWYQSAAFECWEPESWVDRSLESPNIKAVRNNVFVSWSSNFILGLRRWHR